jgi:Fanconi anemia group M protein
MVLARAIREDLLCVLPTGLGKTPIAIALAANRLERYPDSRILVMAPTKPLVQQHLNSFRKTMAIEEDEFQIFTGLVSPGKRKHDYKKYRLIFATPQVIENDLQENRLSLEDFSLLVVDEAHHAIGGYAYPYVAQKYLEQAKNPRILALTASPGGTRQKITEICKNLGITAVEIKTERDEDVEPWVKKKDLEWEDVSLPESFLEIKSLLDKARMKRLQSLVNFGYTKPAGLINKRDLIKLQFELMKSVQGAKFRAIMIVAQTLKIEHALGLLETQGIKPLQAYWEKLGKEKKRTTTQLLKDSDIMNAMKLTYELFEKGSNHPKMGKLCSVIHQQISENAAAKIIVFANYRNTVREIVDALKNVDGARPVEFVGQKEGMTQKEQIRRIGLFRDGEYNVLVGTSISEEGLDIPAMDLAVFYEPVPSEIRSIQRRGRVGRQTVGRIVILRTLNTRDEAYYWSAVRKEKIMKKTLQEMKAGRPQKQKKTGTLMDFV